MATNPVKTFYDMDDVEVDIVAHQLASARKLAVNLANTSTDTSFDGSQDQTGIKVSGTLGVGNGGTGKSSVTANSYLKGNGTGALVERTYAQVRSDLGVSDGANKVEASSSNGKIKIDGTETTVYTHPAGSAASKTGVPTTDATPGFGGTFKVNQISTDSTSHVSAVTERTITIPNTTGTASAAGLTKLYTGTGTNTDGTMTQSAIKTALDAKAPLASPALTGTPTAPTATAGTNTTQIATTAFVQNSIPTAITASDINDIWST